MAVNWTPQEVQRKTRQAVVTTITRICTNIEEHAVNAIMSPPKTGKIYRTRGVAHQASAPGEAPANDLGRLVNSRVVTVDAAALLGTVRFATEYALALEKGTVHMAPRPFLVPALIHAAADRNRILAAELKAALG